MKWPTVTDCPPSRRGVTLNLSHLPVYSHICFQQIIMYYLFPMKNCFIEKYEVKKKVLVQSCVSIYVVSSNFL